MCSVHKLKARLQAKIESMFGIQLPLWLNTFKHCCNIRWKGLVLNNAVRILPGCREISVRRNQCLRKFMCLQNKANYSSPKKYQTFCSGRAASCGHVRGLEKVYMGRQNTATALLYKGSTCTDCICSEKACRLQPLLASGIFNYSEAAIYPFQHPWTCKLAGAAFWLPAPTMSSQYRKFMLMRFCCT